MKEFGQEAFKGLETSEKEALIILAYDHLQAQMRFDDQCIDSQNAKRIPLQISEGNRHTSLRIDFGTLIRGHPEGVASDGAA